MKKIIATVLAMVMALALCTVAFATTYGDLYKQNAAGGWEKQELDGGIAYTSPVETKSTDGKLVSAKLGYYTFTIKGNTSSANYVEVAKDDATFQLTVDGSVKYLAVATAMDTTNAYTLKGTEVKAKGADAKCGEIETITSGKLYLADGKYYVTGTGTYLLADGHVVEVTAAGEGSYTVKEHQFEIVSQAKDSAGVITGSLKCKNCPQTATLTNKPSAIPVGASSVAGTANTFGEGLYAYWTEGSTTPSTGTTTKPSPKTFDAGIAMYVGMALTSVAGSAVVIGKKKEF